MKRVFVVLIVVVVLMGSSFSVLAADMEVNVNGKQAEEQEKAEQGKGKEIEVNFNKEDASGGFKGNGGPMMTGLMLDFSDLNDVLASANQAGHDFATFDQDYIL